MFDPGFKTAKKPADRNEAARPQGGACGAQSGHKHDGKERQMEEARHDQKTSDIKVKRKKRKWLNAFGRFLMYGGFMLIIILGFIIYIVISVLIK